MRFYALALVSVATLAACAKGDKPADSAVAVADTPMAAPASGTTPAGGTMAMAPITGKTHEIKMIGDDKGYRFEPANITVKAGDGIKFTMISGGPHNVAFDPATVADDVEMQLDANMGTDKSGMLSSGMKMNANESVTVSFANVKPGTYPFNCTPHLAMNMKGVVTVQ